VAAGDDSSNAAKYITTTPHIQYANLHVDVGDTTEINPSQTSFRKFSKLVPIEAGLNPVML
jgi:hypothetical protein